MARKNRNGRKRYPVSYKQYATMLKLSPLQRIKVAKWFKYFYEENKRK